MTTKTRNTVIETDRRRGAYDMIQTRAIIHHHTLGRILLTEGFGGTDSREGGAYRFKHGLCYKITETDTIESLFECDADGYTDVDGLYAEEFSGKTVNKIAESVGL